MNVLLSVRPKYVAAMIDGRKRFEFRKSIFRRPDVLEVWVYATAPTQKIIGKFSVGRIVEDTPENLWAQCNGLSGMTKSEFFQYFDGASKGFALELAALDVFEDAIDPHVAFPNFVPPQSFLYFDDNLLPRT